MLYRYLVVMTNEVTRVLLNMIREIPISKPVHWVWNLSLIGVKISKCFLRKNGIPDDSFFQKRPPDFLIIQEQSEVFLVGAVMVQRVVLSFIDWTPQQQLTCLSVLTDKWSTCDYLATTFLIEVKRIILL